MRPICKCTEVATIHIHADEDSGGHSKDRPISVEMFHVKGDRGYSTFYTWLYRGEALELGKALVMAASTHVEGKVE